MHLPPPAPLSATSSIVELRQYTLHPGRRDELIELFDREFVESQEALGMRVLGQFRDLDDPNRFVWLRSFADMDARRHGLGAFYGGPTWAAHGPAANATMIDSDDVLLLRPTAIDPVLTSATGSRRDDPATVTALNVAAMLSFDDVSDADRRASVHAAVRAAAALDIETVATLETEPAENTFPALPVRTGEHVVVWITRFDSTEQHARSAAALEQLTHELGARSTEWRRLRPTNRSTMR